MAGPRPPPRPALGHSRVNSSTNSGTPSVRSAIWSTTVGRAAVAGLGPISSATCRAVSRFRATCVWTRLPFHGGSYSGRKVKTARTRRLAAVLDEPAQSARWTGRPSAGPRRRTAAGRLGPGRASQSSERVLGPLLLPAGRGQSGRAAGRRPGPTAGRRTAPILGPWTPGPEAGDEQVEPAAAVRLGRAVGPVEVVDDRVEAAAWWYGEPDHSTTAADDVGRPDCRAGDRAPSAAARPAATCRAPGRRSANDDLPDPLGRPLPPLPEQRPLAVAADQRRGRAGSAASPAGRGGDPEPGRADAGRPRTPSPDEADDLGRWRRPRRRPAARAARPCRAPRRRRTARRRGQLLHDRPGRCGPPRSPTGGCRCVGTGRR